MRKHDSFYYRRTVCTDCAGSPDFSDDAKRAAIIPAVVAVIFIGISCVSYVPTGYTGIVTTFGKVEDGTKDAGVVFKAPWQSIVKMDNVFRK